jgi:hypothetical protein
MAKYTDAFIRDVAEGRQTAPTAYVQRLARNYGKGVSRAQAGGHARVAKGEKPISVLRGTQGTRGTTGTHTAPKIKRQVINLPRGGKQVNTYKTENAFRHLEKHIADGTDKRRRVNFQVFDPHTGVFVDVYKGTGQKPHGITIDEFLDRINEKLESGEASDIDEAMRQTISGDSAEGDYPEEEEYAPEDFTQMHVNILPI